MVENNKYNFIFKVLITGEGGVGKTTMVYKYVDGKFKDDFKTTIGTDLSTKRLQIDNIKCDLSIWDFSGQKHFKDILPCYKLGSNGIIYVFDLNRLSSITYISEWLDILGDYKNVPMILVGSKSDVISENDYKIKESFILDIKEKYNFINYIIISSKIGLNVNTVFEELTRAMLNEKICDKKIEICINE